MYANQDQMAGEEVWTPLKVLDWTEKKFTSQGLDSPRLDAQVLLAHVLNCDKVGLYTQFDKPLGKEELSTYRELIKQRMAGIPVAYLIGKKEFYSLDFSVDQRVLIPRPDTELLVDRAIEVVGEINAKSVLELCTGSGAVAIALALNTNLKKIIASDICEDALVVARKNVERFELAERVTCVSSDMWEGIPKEKTFDLIISNPPYIRKAEIKECSVEVRKEPLKALDGGEDGLDFYRRILDECQAHVRSGGRLILEHGFDQRNDIESMVDGSGGTFIKSHKDLAGLDRMIEIQF